MAKRKHNNKETDIIIGRVVRAAREESELSQAELATALEWDRCTIVTIESGARALSVSEVWMLSAALKLHAAELLARVEREMKAAARRARRAAAA